MHPIIGAFRSSIVVAPIPAEKMWILGLSSHSNTLNSRMKSMTIVLPPRKVMNPSYGMGYLYPLILHDPYTALLTLAIKVPSSFWKYFWFWIDSHEDTNFLHDELIGYLCYTVVPQLISEDVQRQACHEELEKLKPHEMTSTPMIMALQATGLSQQISPSLHDAIGLSQQIAPSLPW